MDRGKPNTKKLTRVITACNDYGKYIDNLVGPVSVSVF